MSGPVPSSGWSRARLAGVASFLLAAHVAMIWALGDRPLLKDAPVPHPPPVSLLQRDGRGLPALPAASPFDPTLFALPHPKGFSGAAWMEMDPLDYALPIWSEGPRWLQPATADFGAGLAAYLRANTLPSLAGVQLSQPPLARVSLKETALRTQSTLRVEGRLSGRALVEVPSLPSLASALPLPDTTVEVLVNRDGYVVSARLLDQGAPANPDRRAAALQALRLARGVIFAPATEPQSSSPRPVDEWISGRVVFQWHTAPPLPP